MKKSTLVCALGLLAAVGAQAQEVGRVLASTPIYHQVAVPRQVCTQQPVAVQQPNSGGGAVLGAIAGGAVGNAIGSGSGRAAATMLGLIGGAMLGNNIEGSGAQVQNVQQCSTQTYYENRAVGYQVTYEYNGRQYQVQMPQDPGPTIQLQVTPVGASMPPPDTYPGSAPQAAPILVAPPQPQVVAPVYYYPPRTYYYPPIGFSLNLGYSHHHRNWR